MKEKTEVVVELNLLQRLGSKIFLCPFIGRTKYQMIGYVITYILLLCTAVQLSLTIYFNESDDWLEIINVVPNFGVVVMGLIKFTRVQTNKELYDRIVHHYYNEVWEIVSDSREQRDIIARYIKNVRFFNRFLMFYCAALIAVVNSFPYIVMTFDRRINGISDEYLYPFDGWYPFDKFKWYWSVYIWESVMTTIVIWVYVFLNLIHAAFIGFISMELKIIGNHLENLITDEHDTKTVLKLKTLISRHSFLTKTSANLDSVLGDAMLLNYSLGAVFICLTAFTVTVVGNFYKAVRYASMCASVLLDALNQCIYGQIISDHICTLYSDEKHLSLLKTSEELTDAVFFSDWPNASAETKKILLMFMVRTQKAFQITAKGFVPMNMNTFTRICSSSYQMFNLIRTVYAKKY